MTDYPHRVVEVPSTKALRRLLEDMIRAIQTHRPAYKMYLATQVWVWCAALSSKVPTNLKWATDLFRTEQHPIADILLPVFIHGSRLMMSKIPDADEERIVTDMASNEAPLAFIVLKSMAFSDDLNWFVPSEDLVYSLLATDLMGLYPGDVFLPLPVLFIELPPRLLRSRSDRGLHEVRAIAVTEGIVDVDGAADSDFVRGRRLMVSLIREPLPTDTLVEDVSSITFSIPLNDPDVMLTELVQREDEFAAKAGHGVQVSSLMWGSIADVEYGRVEFRNAVMSFVLGVLMYMTTSTATRKPRHVGERKAGKHKDKSSSTMRNKEWLIGTEVKVSSDVKDAVRKGTRTAHVVKTLVRGYFRRQHHGPKNSLTKMVQIQPHVRNYGLPGPIQGHTYKE